jgi:hypothetical protein
MLGVYTPQGSMFDCSPPKTEVNSAEGRHIPVRGRTSEPEASPDKPQRQWARNDAPPWVAAASMFACLFVCGWGVRSTNQVSAYGRSPLSQGKWRSDRDASMPSCRPDMAVMAWLSTVTPVTKVELDT